MKKIINLTYICLFLFISLSCNNDPITPPEDQPGRRDYAWTVDTIPNYMTRMWGYSPTDVWVVGPPGDFSKSIYHFDGLKWSTDEVFRLVDPHSIFGFSSNNIYMGSSNGRIWHFDGTWKEIAALTKDGHSDIVFDNMWGTTTNLFGRALSNDLYAFGAYVDEKGNFNKSIIAHYFSGKWEMLNTDGLFGIVVHLYKNSYDKKIYMQVIEIGGAERLDSTYIYEYASGKYSEIYGDEWLQGLQADISLINGEVYFALGSEIATRVDNKFQTVLKVDNPNFYQRIWGRGSKDIFLMMVDGLAHYNGTDIEYLFHYPFHTQIAGAALFENDVFFLVYQSQGNLNLIYHGKINNGG